MLFELGPCIVGFETTAIFPFVDFVELEIEFFATLVFFFDTFAKAGVRTVRVTRELLTLFVFKRKIA